MIILADDFIVKEMLQQRMIFSMKLFFFSTKNQDIQILNIKTRIYYIQNYYNKSE